MNQTRREQISLHFKGKKYLPLDMRAKKTRAIRRRLTADEASRKTLKQKKRETNFPARKYTNLVDHLLTFK